MSNNDVDATKKKATPADAGEEASDANDEALLGDGEEMLLDAGEEILLDADAGDEAASGTGGFGDLDQVRQILFGQQSQQIEHRLNRLEARIDAEMKRMREESDSQFAAVQDRLDQVHQALERRLDDERGQRAEAEQQLAASVEAVAGSLQENRAQLDHQIETTAHALRSELGEASSTVAQDVQTRFDDLSRRLEEEVAALRAAKTNRADLAALFGHLSERLRDDGA